MALHLGALAKGYAVDRAIQVLKEHGIDNALVNAGGDLMAVGHRTRQQPWRVGLQHPRSPQDLIASFGLSAKAVATSGDYQKYFIKGNTRYHHILDPKSGEPVRLAKSATVIASSVMDADALATAIFVLGKDKGIALADSIEHIEAMVVPSSGATGFSQGFRSQTGFKFQGDQEDVAN